MGITYKAYDTNRRCNVALKVINNAYLDSETARANFLREARAIAALRHPNVAPVLHLGVEGDNYFYATEFIDGETLDAFIKRQGPLGVTEALEITLQVSRALAGATLYFMLTGRPPFSGSVAQIMGQHLYKSLPLKPLEGFPTPVISLVQSMMEKDRGSRPQTPLELQQEIFKCLEQVKGRAPRPLPKAP
jgi:serine/threonine protein kinase